MGLATRGSLRSRLSLRAGTPAGPKRAAFSEAALSHGQRRFQLLRGQRSRGEWGLRGASGHRSSRRSSDIALRAKAGAPNGERERSFRLLARTNSQLGARTPGTNGPALLPQAGALLEPAVDSAGGRLRFRGARRAPGAISLLA